MNDFSEIRSVSFVGSGNVATHLSAALLQSGIQIREVFSLNESHAEAFSKKTKCSIVSKLNHLDPDIDLILLCVPDHQVKKVAGGLAPGKAIIAHTSGIVSLIEIKSDTHPTGVFYPLQTFSKNRTINFQEIPFCIEGETHHTSEMLTQLAYKLSNKVVTVASSQREILHLTAVMVNNFSNMLYGMAHEILLENNLDFKLLTPLIRETANKVTEMTPQEAQTGPARRKDETTIQRHQELLQGFPHYQELYQLITDHIIKKHHE
jgi:predicted short-subunit dehydrogenase-like oxidoreductase (DUF2520 family)